MAVFLTSEWFVALDAAARQIGPPPGVTPGQRLVLEQEVHDGPGGVVRYQVVLDARGVHVEPSPTERADLTFVCDYATAAALARGETNAQQSLMAGRLRLRGDVERFAASRDVLVTLGDVFARVRAVTEF